MKVKTGVSFKVLYQEAASLNCELLESRDAKTLYTIRGKVSDLIELEKYLLNTKNIESLGIEATLLFKNK